MLANSPKSLPYSQETTSPEREFLRSETIRVYLADSQFVTLSIGPTCLVEEVGRLTAESLELKSREHFGVFEQSIRNDSLVEKQLADNETLSLITLQRLRRSDCRLVFKCKLFLELALLEAEGVAVQLYYAQVNHYVTTGYYYTTPDIAVSLAARQLQTVLKTYDPSKHLSGFLQPRLKEFFSQTTLDSVSAAELERKTLSAFSVLPSVSSEQSKRLYLLEARKIPTFGCSFFYVRQRKVKSMPEHLYLGVRSSGLLLARYNNRELIRAWSFDSISRWGYSEGSFHVQLKTYNGNYEMHWEFFTSEAEGIVGLLDSYMYCVLKDLNGTELPVSIESYQHSAAVSIQAAIRGFLVRKRMENLQQLMAVRLIEYHWLRLKM